ALGVVGLLLAGKDLRMQLFCAAAFFIQYWVISSWSIWWAGASFGHRMFISALPFLAFGVARLLESVDRRRAWVCALIAFLVVWNFGYVVQYGSGMISRQESVPFLTLAYNNVVTVPSWMLAIVTGKPRPAAAD
ncbi:MAG: hypothetical protein K1X53_01065, partial [Candidatus Sumerlaeaceae bacterium]|nr:hypothetical protein [Candidatus Sumerlaeaceae bacterium]